MRYIQKQQHNMSCGPVAVMNALKWFGFDVSYRNFLDDFEWCSEDGIDHREMDKHLKKFKIKTKKMFHPTVQDIEKVLDKGSAVILEYMWYYNGRRGGHFVFVDKQTPTRFLSKNSWLNGRKTGMTKKEMAKYFRISKRHAYSLYLEDRDRCPIMWEFI